MQYSYHRPDPLLSSFVQTVLVISGGLVNRPSDLPLVTSGMPAILYKTTNDDSHTITIYGESIPDDNLEIDINTTLIAFLFRPFAIAPMLKIGVKELKAKPTELSTLDAQKWMAVRLQLISSTSIHEKINILNHFLVTQWSVNKRDCEIIQFATDRMIENARPEVLSEIVKQLNVTERTFQRIFKHYTGISANQYRRICQFYFAFSQLKGNHFDKQTDVAFDNHYFDQSHYIRSFKEFTDITPNEYLQSGLPGAADKKGPS